MSLLIRDIIENSAKAYADVPAIKWKEKKKVCERSYGELLKKVTSVRKGLTAMGLSGKHIALIGSSSVEWVECYLGITTGNAVAVPLDAGLPCGDLADLINRSDSEALFLSSKHKFLLDAIAAQCPKLKKIWLLQENGDEGLQDGGEPADACGNPAGASQNTPKTDKRLSCLSELKAAGADAGDISAPNPDDIATIIFTSGTTSKSKGVMLTQNNLASNVEAVNYTAAPGTVVLSALPIHHAYCLVMDWLKGFSLGCTICINDSLLHMVKNMGLFKPDLMLMVPLMIETIYKRLTSTTPALPRKLLASHVFGKNLKTIFVGGAHLDPFYIEKFAEFGIGIYEGYGMSECSPVISSNTPGDFKTGSIGRPLANAEIAFEDGEILVRGSSVMKGYYKMPDETAQALRDGWLHTGDKGYLDEDGFLFINGRVKNLIILSNGENISPEEIENKLSLGRLVGEVIVTGENNGLTARIYPDQDTAARKKMNDEDIRKELQEFLDEYNKTQPTYRQITGLVVRKNPFARSSTKKIRRQEAANDVPLTT